jgi:hypothetical protein
LKVLRHVAHLPVNQNQPCPGIGSEVNSKFGDVDCDDDVDSVDALRILRYVAMLPNNLPDGCGPIGPSPAPTPTPTPHPGSIDQKLTGDPTCAFANFRGSVSGTALAQEFVPSTSILLGVDICLSADGGEQVDLNIRDGTADAPGTILASISGTAGAGDTYLHFDLAAPLPVTPGHMLVLQLPQTHSFAWLGTCAQIFGSCTSVDPDLYPPGKASDFAGDFAFRTYGANP